MKGSIDTIYDIDISKPRKMSGAGDYSRWNEVVSSEESRVFTPAKRLTVFPESVEPDEVEYYEATIKAKINREDLVRGAKQWRFLTVKLGAEEYAAEKSRIQSISYADGMSGEGRRILKSDGGFEHEAYIAVWEGGLFHNTIHEYALFNDGEKRVTYVYVYGAHEARYKGGENILNTSRPWSFIPMAERNLSSGGFSIYDEEE